MIVRRRSAGGIAGVSVSLVVVACLDGNPKFQEPTGTTSGPVAVVPAQTEPAWRVQVREGLVGLGWSAKEADRAVDVVADDAGESPDVAALLRAALRTLSRS